MAYGAMYEECKGDEGGVWLSNVDQQERGEGRYRQAGVFDFEHSMMKRRAGCIKGQRAL
jgi:hypothetical protein